MSFLWKSWATAAKDHKLRALKQQKCMSLQFRGQRSDVKVDSRRVFLRGLQGKSTIRTFAGFWWLHVRLGSWPQLPSSKHRFDLRFRLRIFCFSVGPSCLHLIRILVVTSIPTETPCETLHSAHLQSPLARQGTVSGPGDSDGDAFAGISLSPPPITFGSPHAIPQLELLASVRPAPGPGPETVWAGPALAVSGQEHEAGPS